MNRVELKKQKCTELFGGFAAEGNPDKEFLDILQNFQFGAEKGLETQKSIFGTVIDQAYANAPEGQLHPRRLRKSGEGPCGGKSEGWKQQRSFDQRGHAVPALCGIPAHVQRFELHQ